MIPGDVVVLPSDPIVVGRAEPWSAGIVLQAVTSAVDLPDGSSRWMWIITSTGVARAYLGPQHVRSAGP